MRKILAGLLMSALLLLLFFTGCKKFEKTGHLKQAGIALTFDDDRVDNWFQHLAYLDSANIKATFFISKYNRFTAEQKHRLSVIQSHGHEIAFHGTNHYNMLDYVYKYKHTTDELMRNEIVAGLKLMNRDGFYPTVFAYPYGAHNAIFDKMLMRYFKSVRALNGSNDFTKSLVSSEHNNLLYGLGIDKSSKRSNETVMQVIKSAADNNDCAVLVAHDINSSGKLSVTMERLDKISNCVKRLGLKYYTISEISQ